MVEHGKHRTLVNILRRSFWLAPLLAALMSTAAAANCRQALAIGMDVSGSVSPREHQLQLQGLARALVSPTVRSKILQMPSAPVHLFVYEWSGPTDQTVVLPWTAIRSGVELDKAVEDISTHVRQPMASSTAVGSAMEFGAAALESQNTCWQQTLDISGDGIHIAGPHPQHVKSDLRASGLRINGLVIGVDMARTAQAQQLEIGELSSYYNAFVIMGPGAFVETALGFNDFERAMTRKLERELQGLVIGMAPRRDHPKDLSRVNR